MFSSLTKVVAVSSSPRPLNPLISEKNTVATCRSARSLPPAGSSKISDDARIDKLAESLLDAVLCPQILDHAIEGDCQLADLVVTRHRQDLVSLAVLNLPGAFEQPREPGHHSVRHDDRHADADQRGEREHDDLENDQPTIEAVGLSCRTRGQCSEFVAHRRQVLAEQAAIGSKIRSNMPGLFGAAGAERLGHSSADFDEVGQGAIEVAEAAADIGHRYTFFDTLPGVLHNLIELLFRLFEGRRQHSGLAKALRLALLRDRSGIGPGVAQIRREPQQIELIPVGEDIDCSNRGVQRQVIVHHAGELLADFALQQKRRRSRHRKQQEKAKGQRHDLAA